MRFEIALTWEVEEGVLMPLRVMGVQQPYIPENRRGHPDTWMPAEGGELEDMKVYSGGRLPRHIEDRLLADDSFMRSVAEKIEQNNMAVA